MQVRWDDLGSATYESMVAVLISRLYPSALRIDGSGGDGGRDVLVEDGPSIHAFELKSFTGRLTKHRRAQVKRSLERAARANPTSWTLVVPIDPTPGELEWFRRMEGKVPFPLIWRGKTWLDSKLATMPEISRYFCSDEYRQVIDLLRQLEKERAAIKDVPSGVKRLRGIRDRLDEIDPYFRYDFAVGESALGRPPASAVLSVKIGDARIDVIERYRGALRDRPITGKFTLRLDRATKSQRQEIDESFDFGTPATIRSPVLDRFEIDAPGGLGTVADSGIMRIANNERPADSLRDLVVELYEGDSVVASLPFVLNSMRKGRRGLIFNGHDHTRCVAVTLRIDMEGRAIVTSYRIEFADKETLPSALRPVARWLREMRGGRDALVRLQGSAIGRVAVKDTFPGLDGLYAIVDALEVVQRHGDVYFPFPIDLTANEAKAIIDAARLIRGETLRSTWSDMKMTLIPYEHATPGTLTTADGDNVRIEGDHVLEIRGHRIPIGRVITQMNARVREPEAFLRAFDSGDEVEVRLEPASNDVALRWLAAPLSDEAAA